MGSGAGRGNRLRLALLFATAAAFLAVPAAQAFASAGTLQVNITGSGSGEVSSAKGYGSGIYKGTPPIECSGPPAAGVCTNEADEEAVLLEAKAAPGSEFAGWTVGEGEPLLGCASSFEEAGSEEVWLACFLYIEEEVEDSVTAKFIPEKGFPLTIAKTGEGTVASSPGGIECGGKCTHSFEGTVTLTASPASGYAFSAWAGCTEHVGLTCKVLMDKAKTVKVTFVKTPSLTIEKAGSGQGKVGATGISCDENCSEATSAIKTGTSVTVKVTSAKGSEPAVFEGGTGSASGCSGASCTFTISADSSVKVKFNPKPTRTLKVNLTGPAAYKGKVSGKGTVKGLTASAISCGAGCTSQTESFFEGDTVTLTAVAGTGYTFAGWFAPGEEVGTCTGTTSPCTLSTSASRALSAEFK
jgi:hypothetical protein